MSKWIRFVEVEYPENLKRKTQRWVVKAVQGDLTLGWITWYSPWRKYAFHPVQGTVFEWDCLTDIAMFVQARTQEHKLAKT